MNNILRRKRVADTEFVNDATCMRQSVITRVVNDFYDTLYTEKQRRHMIKVLLPTVYFHISHRRAWRLISDYVDCLRLKQAFLIET